MAVAEKDGNWYLVQSRPVIVDGKKSISKNGPLSR